MKNYFLLSLLFLGIWGCSTGQTESNEVKEPITTVKHFGEKISIDNAITYDAMLTDLSSKDSVEAKVKGKVSGVCQAKGCWMTIVSEEEGKPEMFVKFKDYGFFMPLDLAGSEVVMAGKAFREETSVDELRHYAEDEGQSAEEIAKITEPVEELKFLAYGVVVVEN